MKTENEISIGRATIIKLTVCQTAIFLTIALGYAAISGDLKAIGVTVRNCGTSIIWGVILFFGVVPLLYLPRHLRIRNQLEEVLASRLSVRDILSLNFLVSSSEELFFRGFLLGLIGVIPSSLVFGVMHYIGYNSFFEVIYAISTGLLMGYLYKYYLPNILFPITFHFLANTFSLLITRRWVRKMRTKGFETNGPDQIPGE